MACKIRCTNCGAMLKEEGDEGKVAQGTYRVFDAKSSFYTDEDKPSRVLRCSACRAYFDDFGSDRARL